MSDGVFIQELVAPPVYQDEPAPQLLAANPNYPPVWEDGQWVESKESFAARTILQNEPELPTAAVQETGQQQFFPPPPTGEWVPVMDLPVFKGMRMSRIEPVDVVESWGLPFHLGAVVECIFSSTAVPGDPHDKQLLVRAAQYLDRYIKTLKDE